MSYVDDLIRDISDLTRRIGALERIEIPPVPSIVPTFSGTPAANDMAYWTVSGNLAGTISGSGINATRNLTAASTDGPVVSILQDHATDDQPALKIINDAVEAIRLDSNTIGPYMTFYLANVIKAYLGLAWAANTIITGAAAGDLTIRTTAGKILFSTDNGATAHTIMSGDSVGIGVSPSYPLHVRKDQNTSTAITVQNGTDGNIASALFQAINSAGDVMQFGVYPSLHSYGAIAGRDGFMYSVGNIVLMSDAAAGVIKFATGGNAEKARLDASGNLGVGVTTAQGKLHGHDGTGGFLFVSKTTIVGVAQTIIPDGTGDILKYVIISGVYDNSASQVGELITATAVGGTSDVTQDAGTNTLRFSVSAGGALTVIRQAGSATWNITAHIIWK